MSDVFNMILYMGSCVSEGRIEGNPKEEVNKFEHTDPKTYLTFEDKD